MKRFAFTCAALTAALPILAHASARDTTCDDIKAISQRYQARSAWLIRSDADTRGNSYEQASELLGKLKETTADLARLAAAAKYNSQDCALGAAYRKLTGMNLPALLLDNARVELRDTIDDVQTGLGQLLGTKEARACLGKQYAPSRPYELEKLPFDPRKNSGGKLQPLPNFDYRNAPKTIYIPAAHPNVDHDEESDAYGAQ